MKELGWLRWTWVTVDMCQSGMTAKSKDGKEGPVQKKTRIVSNSQEVLKRVDKKCPNGGGWKITNTLS